MPDTDKPEDKSLVNSDKSRQSSGNSRVDEQKAMTDKEYGGPKGKEPTRYGDWEKKGRCIDF
jgi:hypothetical protein